MRAEIRVLRALAAGYRSAAEEVAADATRRHPGGRSSLMDLADHAQLHATAHERAADQLQAEQEAAELQLQGRDT